MRIPTRGIVAIAVVALTTGLIPAPAAAAPPSLTATVVQSGLSIPWDVAFTPEGNMIVTQRGGTIGVYASGEQNAPLLASATVPNMRAQGEAGLMGVAVDRFYAENRYIYVCASRDLGAGWVNQVLRYQIAADYTPVYAGLILDGILANTIHNGCALETDSANYLWVAMGDANNAALAQNPNSYNGKILRILSTGATPPDNPIMPGAAGRSAVISMGHRNPQGIAFSPGSEQVYTVEHGPETNDEINRIVGGGNYGWPCYTGHGQAYSTSVCGGAPAGAFLNPVWASGAPTLATSGGVFLDGANWGDHDGDFFAATLKESDVRRFDVDPSGSTMTLAETLFNGSWGRLRAAVRGPDGDLFLTSSNGSNDRVIRVTPAGPQVIRLAGPDRYATAATVSGAAFAPNQWVAFVATGENFPDGITAGAAAGQRGGPVLLVTRNAIPAATHHELLRLRPAEIVVVGSEGVVGPGVFEWLKTYAPSVRRLGGSDRYHTAALISNDTFSSAVAAAYVATGENFPDALAGVPAADLAGGPVLLVRRDSIPDQVEAELVRLAPQSIVVLGGESVVSEQVRLELEDYTAGPVTRLWGPDRYETAFAVSTHWGTAATAWIPTGENFPDALGAGAAAKANPILLTPFGSLPASARTRLAQLAPGRIYVVGSAGVLSENVIDEIHRAFMP